MPLSPEEQKWIEKLEKNIDRHWDDLNSFEKKFMEDLIERFHQYGERTHITIKQWRSSPPYRKRYFNKEREGGKPHETDQLTA